MEYPKEIVEYFNRRGVSLIFLLRRNLLRRYVSVLANSYDRHAKLLNGTHKSHVHSLEEVWNLFLFFLLSKSVCCVLWVDNRLIFVGWDSFKLQASHQLNINNLCAEGSGVDNSPSFSILQQHSAYYSLLWRYYQEPHCKN